MVSDAFTAGERQLLQALQIDGRAPFRVLAEVLGVSDQTVARRWARLRESGRARVVGLTAPLRLGRASWMVRVRTHPDAALDVATAIARREDTSWVHITSGGTEIVCSTQTDRVLGADSLLLGVLPRSRRVVEVTAHQLLHVFHGGTDSPLLKWGALDEAQVAALVAQRPPVEVTDDVVVLDDLDRALVRLLAVDGRARVEDLSAHTGVPASTVRRRLDALRRSGALYFDVEFDSRRFDTGAPTLVWAKVAPRDLDAAGEGLAELPATAFAAAVTGPSNLYAVLTTQTSAELYRLLSGPVAELPGLTGLESSPVLRNVKAGAPLLTMR
ncbi:Lrp/AsnC family transcriptional regulator [Quadrisphaera granulorum]|uniref:Lrp/AsnC family transcriptional regulator n=1 Tax=Quadrisphaera granulorum TaxID=317664 RepID=UPI000D6DB7D0|nr:Lrp/AsnC family transcriptional regulator [Quadrisphaera granulorum]